MSGIGHIGELQVIEEFAKKHKFEIYLPMKDKGIDFIGVHNNSSVQVQVKTSKFQKSKYYWMDLYKNKMIYSENTFYVFVLYVLPRRKMMGKSKNFLVIPSLDLKEYIENKYIVSKKNDDNCLNIFIYPLLDEKKWIYKNKDCELDLTRYWNNFDLIKNLTSDTPTRRDFLEELIIAKIKGSAIRKNMFLRKLTNINLDYHTLDYEIVIDRLIRDGALKENDGFISYKDSEDLTKLFVEHNGDTGIWTSKA
ncbi:hypothetical protein N9746_06425 [Candidatus Thioglobus sp.]|nr:hypothetical protein [Candidatus Thioglobus sp.]